MNSVIEELRIKSFYYINNNLDSCKNFLFIVYALVREKGGDALVSK